MYRIKQIWLVAMSNFRRWRRNPQIIMVFFLGFIVSFLLSNKVVEFAQSKDTVMQVVEPFIWTFGDATSILVISLLLLLLFADMPNLNNDVPFMLIRINRMVWMVGQIVYMIMATIVYVTFILFSTCILSASTTYVANMWSPTAAILGYSNIGNTINIPVFVKVMEMTNPYLCMLHIYGLMIGYTVLLVSIILYFNLWKNKGGMIGGIIYSGFGFLMTPNVIAGILHISDERMNIANIIFGWISPLNHATYYMHNFGYDSLPRLWVSYVFFAGAGICFFILSLVKIRSYMFNFTGTQK